MEISALLGQTSLPSCGPFFPPWESKVAAMETLDGMPCASLTGAAFKLLSLRQRI